MDTVIEIKHLEKHFGNLRVLNDIDFTIERGKVVTIIGSSGSGKSTLLRCINLLEVPDAGEILFNGQNILKGDLDASTYRSKVGMVFQNFNLFSNKTVLENCMIGQIKVLKKSKEEARAEAMKQLKAVGMDKFADASSTKLSGGQKQRLTIARALVGKPDILILDDSASALDYATDAALRKALAALPGDLTVFIVSQRAASLQHADQIIVLDDGRMVGLGRHAELLESCPVYKEIYESQFKKGDAQK